MHGVATVIEYGFVIAGIMLALSAVGIGYIAYFVAQKILRRQRKSTVTLSPAEKNATLQQIMKDTALLPEDVRTRVEFLIRLL